jgi:4-hydroxybenzoate polyprenyltransferase
MLRPWLELARISNLPTVWTNILAGWLLAGGGRGWRGEQFQWWQDSRLIWLLLGGSLLYTGGMILNDAADVKFDREHRQERPIPSGKVTARTAWTVGLLMLLLGWALALWGFSNFYITLGLVACILFYDLYHKPWAGAVWVMGACRTLLVWMAGSALTGDFTAGEQSLIQPTEGNGWYAAQYAPSGILIPGLALGAYIVGLTLVARMEGKGAPASVRAELFAKGLLYMPGIVAVAWTFSFANLRKLFILGDLRPLAPLILIFIFAFMVVHATRLMRRGGPAIGQAVGILLAGIPIVDALAVSRVSFPLALGFVALFPVLRYWQRFVAAT